MFSTPPTLSTSYSLVSTVYWSVFSPEKAEKVQSGLGLALGSDPDGISALVLKSCSTLHVLAPHLSALFSMCFSFGHLPPSCKPAKVSTKRVQKQTRPTISPVSLLLITNKVMESIIASEYPIFPVFKQPDLRPSVWVPPSHSTLDILLLLFQEWLEALNLKEVDRTIFLDISRTFDTV